MDTRLHNPCLEMRVSRALIHDKLGRTGEIVVAATPDGVVWLRGLAPTQADRMEILSRVGGVPGVTQVFCHIALKS
jgi:osmotically-inducible protein OsmY